MWSRICIVAPQWRIITLSKGNKNQEDHRTTRSTSPIEWFHLRNRPTGSNKTLSAAMPPFPDHGNPTTVTPHPHVEREREGPLDIPSKSPLKPATESDSQPFPGKSLIPAISQLRPQNTAHISRESLLGGIEEAGIAGYHPNQIQSSRRPKPADDDGEDRLRNDNSRPPFLPRPLRLRIRERTRERNQVGRSRLPHGMTETSKLFSEREFQGIQIPSPK